MPAVTRRLFLGGSVSLFARPANAPSSFGKAWPATCRFSATRRRPLHHPPSLQTLRREVPGTTSGRTFTSTGEILHFWWFIGDIRSTLFVYLTSFLERAHG